MAGEIWDLLGNAVTSGGAVAVAWLALRGKLKEISAQTQSAKKDAAASRESAEAIEQSINNRPRSASDRWDSIHNDVRSIRAQQAEQGNDLRNIRAQQVEHSRDIRGMRKDIGELRGADRENWDALLRVRAKLRRVIQDHEDHGIPAHPQEEDGLGRS